MGSENLLQLVLKSKGISQKELAGKLGVSPAQVSKWKSGEYMSFDMEEKLVELANLDGLNPDVVYWTGSVESAKKWQNLINHLAEMANEESECNYQSYPLHDGLDLLLQNLLDTMRSAGAEIPKEFPKKIDFNYSIDDWEENPDLFELLYREHPISSLIYKTLIALARLYDFYVAYISDILDHDEADLFNTPACNIEPCLIELAFAKVGKENDLLPNFNQFRYETLKNYQEWLELVKEKAVAFGIPLKAELMNLVSDDPDYLVHQAEAEAFGFNKSRLHPDIYMDEILRSLRLLHQVLPAICEKLGITAKELNIDESEFRLNL